MTADSPEALPRSGGAGKFLQFTEQELKPNVNETFEADPARHIFFGHSLGGLFGLYTLFTKPEAFHSYMISSPSIWWNQQCILELEPEFIDRLRDGNLKSIFQPEKTIHGGGSKGIGRALNPLEGFTA